jgi:transcriptional regulator with XRE-family HTH domain
MCPAIPASTLLSKIRGCSLLDMVIGQKVRELREAKKLSQGDIEHKTGLLRSYTSRVENGHTVPSVDTLEKYARALEVPLYRFFTDGQQVKIPNLPQSRDDDTWGTGGKERGELQHFAKALSKMGDRDRSILLVMAQKMAQQNAKR